MENEELWATVIGQPEAVSYLQTAVQSPVHAYLFIGPEGAGRRQAAFAFAGSLLVSDSDSEEESQRHRQLATLGQHPDITYVVPQGSSLLVEDAERIIKEASRSPIESNRKIIIVDRFQTAEPEVSASLLKTIEEPPASSVFVLLADDVREHQVTISSRCVRVDLPALSTEVIAEALMETGEKQEHAQFLALASSGSLERARLLSNDSSVIKRYELWESIPTRLDHTGATVVTIVTEIEEQISEAENPLLTKHQQELDDLTEREEAFGTRGSGRKDLATRQKREIRRFREEELTFGLAVLSRQYLDASEKEVEEDILDATQRITTTALELLERNPNETLMLQALFLDLPVLG
ncbi:MAG TPA: hypothetical protein QF762_03620 [Acidimicrobiales bacterium]|nr:hypothetical protein [Acidimicrobiales bacterium]